MTTSGVVEEIRDIASRLRFEVFLSAGLEVREPSAISMKRVQEGMGQSGDAGILSPTDIGLLALSLDTGGTVVTDDFALQNVALHLQVPVLPIYQRRAQARSWRYRCTGCGRYGEGPGFCPVCGSAMKRTIR
ncbi:MAG: nucleotide-binding protein [Methanomicrobiales archaeon]|nr:nucleotide-binding protein [Methanomicrobiales archaeon]